MHLHFIDNRIIVQSVNFRVYCAKRVGNLGADETVYFAFCKYNLSSMSEEDFGHDNIIALVPTLSGCSTSHLFPRFWLRNNVREATTLLSRAD